MKKTYIPVIIILSWLLFIAINADWEYDEAWSYTSVATYSVAETITYSPYYYANNHIINSLWFYLAGMVHTVHPFIYRLLSILSGIVYMYYIIKVVELRSGKKVDIAAAIFLLLPFAVFFAMGRGYATAYAATTASYYFLVRYFSTRYVKDYLLFILAGCIASLSIFSFIFCFAAMFVLWTCKEVGMYKRNKTIFTGKYILTILYSIVIMLPVVLYIYHCGNIINSNDPSIIGSASLTGNGTFSSLLSYICMQGIAEGRLFTILRLLFAGSLLPVLYILVVRKALYYELILILIISLLMMISHFALGSLYPMGRSAAYYIILLYLAFYIAYLKGNKILFVPHFAVVAGLGIALLWFATQNAVLPKAKDAFTLVHADDCYTLYTDNSNDNYKIYNQYLFGNKTKLITYKLPQDYIAHADSIRYCLAARKEVKEMLPKLGFRPILKTQVGNLYKKE